MHQGNQGMLSRTTWVSRLKGTTEYSVDSEILSWGKKEKTLKSPGRERTKKVI